MTIEELSSLLAFSIGVQQRAQTNDGEVPLKTSPSGGARHPIECYVVARDVAGLKPAIYHYACDRHVLERIHGPVSRERIRAYVPESGYFAKASAMVFFTAVFARQLWRYPYSRAYRAALIEAGHVCQTFLLTATSLGLAPYCVMGLADTLVEGDLGIDGITESVLYLCGRRAPATRQSVGRLTAWNAQNPPEQALLAPPVIGCSFFAPPALTQVTTHKPEGTHEFSDDIGRPGDTTRNRFTRAGRSRCAVLFPGA